MYDVQGREVAVLVNENLSPGSYEFEWNASGFPSGVYFYKLQSGQFSETKKMLLTK
ncbi:MAG: T9SS type A sorting domain-containing protein [Ignavibacteria bacterium]